MKRSFQISLVQRRLTVKSNIKKNSKVKFTTDARNRESIRKKLDRYIDTLDPGKHPEAIIRVAGGQLAAVSVNVELAIKFGFEAMNEFQNTLPHGLDKKVSKTLVAQSEGKNCRGNKGV